MDIVLGVSVMTTTVRMVLIEGEKADGVLIECSTFDTANGDAKTSPSEQISARILAIQQNAVSSGHHLVMSGITCDDEAAQANLIDSVAARDLQTVVLVAEQNAAGALARTVGRALGYETTAVLVMKPDTATLSFVDSGDGSISEARTCTMGDGDASDILVTTATTLENANPKPGSVFVVGSRSSVCSVKSSLERLVRQPVIVPEEPEFALARGAALAAANVPDPDASTHGLAYSQDPDELAAFDHAPVKLADADTQAALFDDIGDVGSPHRKVDTRVRIPIGSAAAVTLVVGAVTLAMLVAANIQHADRDSAPAGLAESSALVPELPVTESAAAAAAPAVAAAPAQPPAPQNIPEAIPVAQPAPAPPLAPAVPTRKPVVQIRQPAPSRAIAQPTPVAVQKPIDDTPVAVEPEVAEALPAPPPAIIAPPLPPASSPPLITAPDLSPAAQSPPFASSPWTPPWLPLGTTPSQQQASQPVPSRQWVPSPFGPQQEAGQWPLQHSPLLHIFLPQLQSPAPQQAPSLVPQWTPAPMAPQWTPAPMNPQWTPAPSLQAPIPVTSPSPYQVPLGPSGPSGTYLVPPFGLQPTEGGL